MTAPVLEQIGSTWATWDVDSPSPASALVAGVDRTAEAKVSLLLFDGAHRLVAVAKVARNARGAAAVRAEFDALQWATSLPGLGEVPRAIGYFEVAGMPVLVQSAVSGRTMTAAYYSPRHVTSVRLMERDFELAGTWLDTFAAVTRAESTSLQRSYETWIRPTLARYANSFDLSPGERELFAQISERCRRAATDPVPATARHGDYWMGNLLHDRHRITGVIDWERAARTAHPFTDVFKFPTSYGLYLDRSRPWAGGRVPGHPGREDDQGRWRRYGSWPNLIGFGHAWFGTGSLPHLVRRWVVARCATLGVSEFVAGTFFPVFVVEQAMAFDDAVTRAGWQSALRVLAAERSGWWLW